MKFIGGNSSFWQGGLLLRRARGVPPPNSPPVAGEDIATVTAGETVVIFVLSNDTDPEGGALTVTSASADHGSVVVNAGDTVTYTAPAGFSGTATVTYAVQDAAGNSAEGTVTVTVTPAYIDQPPVTGEDTAVAVAGGSVTIAVLANDADPEGGTLTVTSASADHGSVVVNADDTVTYTAPADFSGTATVTYAVQDAAGNSTEGTVTVTVELGIVDAPPVAGDDTAAIAVAGGSVTVAVLANDPDPEGGALRVTAASADIGSVAVNADDTVTYTAPADFSGTATVTYTIADAAGNTDQGTVMITVTPLRLVIDETTAIGNFSVDAQPGAMTLTILEPAEYASEHVLQTADLAAGPINLIPPRISGGTGAGATLTAMPGVWACDEQHGAPSFAQQWLRGTTPIDGATGSSYLIATGDEATGLRYRRQAANAAGTRAVEVEALAATPPASTFSETAVRFTSGSKLVRMADLGAADGRNVLFFASFVPYATGRQTILRQTGNHDGIEIWDQLFSMWLTVGGAARSVSSPPLTVGRRTNVIAAVVPSGEAGVSLRLLSRFAGESGWTQAPAVAGSGNVDLTFGMFGVGGRPSGTGHELNAAVYRIACWTGATVDPDDPALPARFLKADGTLADPATSRQVYGTPRVDLYGPAADYGAGTNHGSAGNFDLIEGTFSNA